MVAVPVLAFSSLWCHSSFAERSQLAPSQLLRHPLHSRVCLREPRLMKSYPQETISKTDEPSRQKKKTKIEEGRTSKKKSRGDIAEAFKLFVLFFHHSSIFLIILHNSLCPYSYFPPILCSVLLPFYPLL